MAQELASTYARSAIESLMHVHALANMYRGSEGRRVDREHLETALRWMDSIEGTLKSLRRELEENTPEREQS